MKITLYSFGNKINAPVCCEKMAKSIEDGRIRIKHNNIYIKKNKSRPFENCPWCGAKQMVKMP